MGLKPGIGSYAYRYAIDSGTMDALGFLEKAGELGAQAVQICDNLNPLGFSPRVISRLVDWGRKKGLDLEVGIKIASWEDLVTGIEVTREMGGSLLRMVSQIRERNELKETLLRGLERLPDGISLALENHFVYTPLIIEGLIKEINHPRMGVCLDPFNSMALLTGPRETIELLAPLALTVHIKDAYMVREGTGFSLKGCPLGEGALDMDHLLENLTGHTEALHLEGWLDPRDNLEETLIEEERWNREGMAQIRSYCGRNNG